MGYKITPRFLLFTLTMLAFGLRVYRLDNQSYWIDEGWTLYFANRTPSELWQLLQTVVVKPPLYYLSMVYWVKLFGQSEYALRFYAVLFGLLAVPLMYRLGKAIGGTGLGLVTALLMAVSPYQIWHSQDARMYSLLTMASLMSMWGFVEIISNRRTGGQARCLSYFIYIFGTELALLTHYHGFVLIGIQGLFLLLTWQQHWRMYSRWGGALSVVLLCYAPWFMRTWGLVKSYDNWIIQPTLLESYIRSGIAYSVGELVPRPLALWLTLPFGLLYFWGLWRAYQAKPNELRWSDSTMLAFLIAYTLAPNLAAWLYGELKTPVYLERYLIMVQPGYLLTIGILDFRFWIVDLTNLKSTIKNLKSKILLLPLLAINVYILSHHYLDPVYAKENWRGVAEMVNHFGAPGDGVLLTGDGGEQLFQTYYQGHLPVYYPFNIFYLSNKPRLEGEAAMQALSKIATDHRRLWYTPYGMPLDPMLENWLRAKAYPAWQSWLGRKRLALYGSPTLPLARVEQVNQPFGDRITLKQIALSAEPTAAGELLPLRFEFSHMDAGQPELKMSLRLHHSHSDIFAQSDWPSLDFGRVDRRALWIPVDTPPGNYGLQIIIYEANSGQAVGQPLILPNIAIAPATITPPLTALDLPNRTQRVIGNFNIVGYIMPEKVQPGQAMWLWLYWELGKAGVLEQKLQFSLVNPLGLPLPLTESLGALEGWQVGQVRRAVYHLPTSPRLGGKSADLTLALLDEAGQVQAQTRLGQIALETRPRQFNLPTMANRLDLDFGKPAKLKLLGYQLPTSEIASLPTAYSLILYWQAVAEMETNYTVFVQLLNENGQVVAQVDQPPLNGTAPTTTWLTGEILSDPYTLNLPPLPLGTYRLITGLYNGATGERLPVANGHDFVEVGQVTVK